MKRVNESYNQRKDEILRLYKEYLPFKEQYGDNIDSASLDNMCTNIKNGKFLLLVAGEAKSGKSTFINAFLGNKILPMDVKQCTSALIEITHDENVTLSAEYADGRKITKNGEDDVRKFLLEHAALSDNYRNIPITSINNDILIKSKGNIRKDEVDDLINKCKGDNIYGLSDEEYKKLINDYIEEYKDKWCDIVTKITITYPLTEGMQDITMIDSPGVNAAGKVGDITNQYIGKADAIIFVKSLTVHAVESS
jgi:GTPase SAR1 family protein